MRAGVKAALFVLLALLATVSLTRAMWVDIPLEDLLADSDYVVVASLADVKEWSNDKTDFGKGVLTVSEVLSKQQPKVRTLTLLWQNPTGMICPRVVHEESGGAQFLWLLKRQKNGAVTASHPSRVLPLSERANVEKALQALRR
jgi:hypothetical protein